uniref:hypothetical protein n=1 Tax=Tessaracoccus timonensis TaxID=2161816 RepID=UPI000D562964|nr:hypothetical protein [Tessaracoccus timonensis]
MVKQRRLGYTIATTLLLATVTACQSAQPGAQEQPTPTAPTSIRRVPTANPTPSPTPSPSPTAHESFPPPEPGESKEIQAIRKGWEEYENQFYITAKNPHQIDVTPLSNTATGQAQIDVLNAIGEMRDRGWIQTGHVTYRDVKITDPVTDDSGGTTAVITVCKDLTALHLLEYSSKQPPQLEEGQVWPEMIYGTYTMYRHPNGQWVVSDEAGEMKEC